MAKRTTTKTTKAAKSVKVATIKHPNFRVYRLPKSLRVECSKSRAARDQTVADFVTMAVEQELAGLLGDVRVLFSGRFTGPKGPARLPISDQSLADLKDASKLGVPAATLLEMCLSRAANSAPKRTRKPRSTKS